MLHASVTYQALTFSPVPYNDEEEDEEEDDACGSGESLWWVGIILGLLGSIFINTGNNFQSLGMHQLAERKGEDCNAEKEGLDPTSSLTWRVGTAVFISGALLNFASYAFAAQSMLASLESIQFVTNILFSRFMLQKRITWRMYGGTVLICAGTVVAVLHSSKAELCATARDLIRNYTNNVPYQIFLLFTVVLAVSLQIVYVAYKRSVDAGQPLPCATTVLPVTYAAFSALFGTQSVVQAKCLAELLQAAAPTVYPVFLHWFTYVALVSWIGLVVVWLARMNAALGLYDPIFIIPLLQVDFILFAIVAGGIYFREFAGFTTSMWIGFTLGIVIVFVGLFMLAPADENDAALRSSKIAPVSERRDDATNAENFSSSPATVVMDKLAPAAIANEDLEPAGTSPSDSAPQMETNTSRDDDADRLAARRRSSVQENDAAETLRGAPAHREKRCETNQVAEFREEESGNITPRSRSLPGGAVPRKSLRLSTLNYVTSISAQFNKNELSTARSSRPSFDVQRRHSDVFRRHHSIERRRSLEDSRTTAIHIAGPQRRHSLTTKIVSECRKIDEVAELHSVVERINSSSSSSSRNPVVHDEEVQADACVRTI
ncbi:hypothetical protein CTAYLR_002344 [Chrysophaeum taylorii]|uniref:Magnesium transporter n=1 Tax=Chrysophaeum taylorii TaxID=2483200 RepID=A0AAD7XQM5_9STRA|nr:hypothetical protein CTAYLR_002344 [Chrysophaeum taylorii]